MTAKHKAMGKRSKNFELESKSQEGFQKFLI